MGTSLDGSNWGGSQKGSHSIGKFKRSLPIPLTMSSVGCVSHCQALPSVSVSVSKYCMVAPNLRAPPFHDALGTPGKYAPLKVASV